MAGKLLTAFLKLLSLMPLGVHYFLCGGISWLARAVFRYRYDVVMANIARSFPDKKYKEIKTICRQFYRHLGDLIAETVWFLGSSEKRVRSQRICSYKNPEVIIKAFESSENGVVLMNSHIGNWEIMGGYKSYNYTPEALPFDDRHMCVLYKRLHSKAWDAAMTAGRLHLMTEPDYDGYIETRNWMRYALSHKGMRKIYHCPMDQYPYSIATPLRVNDFMHQKTVSMGGGAAIARKLHMPVVYMCSHVESRGHYVQHFELITEDASTMSIEEVMNRYYTLLQRDIEAQPWNYLWSHRRWKPIVQTNENSN
ncbi:MAG: hypothetical protein IJS07_06710 [Bacteroidales bacterium]|nr:hypothetical protein [Bacteroidales bacterium]